jgi:hypothetical protein
VKSKNVLLVSHPWRFYFGVLEVEQLGEGVVQQRARWVKFTLLNYSFGTDCLRASHIREAGSALLYLDEEGAVCSVRLEREGWVDQLFTGRKRHLTVRRRKQPSSPSLFST